MGWRLRMPPAHASPGDRGYRWQVRLRAAIFLALLAACTGPSVRPPEGITVVAPEEPPPPASAIAAAQRRLQEERLYLGPITGALTPAVRVALAQLQRLRELPVTGTLNAETADALGLGDLASWPTDVELEGRERPEPEGPSAAEILELEEVPALPQPPPGALAEAGAAAARLLAIGTGTAAMEVARATESLPGTAFAGDQRQGEEIRAAEGGEGAEQLAEPADLRRAEQAADRAQGALGSARREAFALLLAARQAGGFALLPDEIIAALEEALQARSLLLRGQDRKLGPDDQVAIRWVERSFGLPVTGLPSLPLLETLGIDPSPMFEAD